MVPDWKFSSNCHTLVIFVDPSLRVNFENPKLTLNRKFH